MALLPAPPIRKVSYSPATAPSATLPAPPGDILPSLSHNPPAASRLPHPLSQPPPPDAPIRFVPASPRPRQARPGSPGSSLVRLPGPGTRSSHPATIGIDPPSDTFAHQPPHQTDLRRTSPPSALPGPNIPGPLPRPRCTALPLLPSAPAVVAHSKYTPAYYRWAFRQVPPHQAHPPLSRVIIFPPSSP